MLRARALLLALGLACATAYAQTVHPPTITPEAQAEADQILAMSSSDPAGRLNQLIQARGMDNAGLFVIAGRTPGLVEQLLTKPYTVALDYIQAMPAPELHEVRHGDSVIRPLKDMQKGSQEVKAAIALAHELGFSTKKLEAVRVGPLEGRVIRVEVTVNGQGRSVELCWPSTPERDEQSRDLLGKIFGARPSQNAVGTGSALPLLDGSFEDPASLSGAWKVENAQDLGGGIPVADVLVDDKVAIDGLGSLRFFNTIKTRQLLQVAQRVTVAPGTSLVAHAQLQTESVRAEWRQDPHALYLEMSFEDGAGNRVGAPIRAEGAKETHTWQQLEVAGIVPDAASYVRIALMSGLSGTAWFDGVTLQIGE